MNKRFWALLLAAAMLTGCTGPQGPASTSTSGTSSEAPALQTALPQMSAGEYPRVDGSTANLPLMAELYSRVCGIDLATAENEVTASKTYDSWYGISHNHCELLLVYEPPADFPENFLKGLDIQPVGRDALVFLVNEENTVESLTQDELRGIYTGSITDWAEVGSAPGEILPYQRNHTSGSQTMFLKLLMGDTEPMEPLEEYEYGAMAGLISAVAEFDGGERSIGYSVFFYASEMYANPDVRLLAVDGVTPTNQTIEDGSYPLVNSFYVVIREDEPEGSPARQLRDWLLTEEGAQLLRDAGYVPA